MKFTHSKNRIEGVSDGVFAFAATLLVINIGTDAAVTSFKEEIPNFLSFAVSFFAMMAIWKVHYNYFRRTDFIDNWVIAYNMILLFMVLFYVFPIRSLLSTGFEGKQIGIDDFSQIFQLYSLGFLLIFLCISLMYNRAYKKEKQKNLKLLFYKRHFIIFVLVGVISFLLATFQVGLRYGLPGIIYSSLGPICYFHSKSFHTKHNLAY